MHNHSLIVLKLSIPPRAPYLLVRLYKVLSLGFFTWLLGLLKRRGVNKVGCNGGVVVDNGDRVPNGSGLHVDDGGLIGEGDSI